MPLDDLLLAASRDPRTIACESPKSIPHCLYPSERGWYNGHNLTDLGRADSLIDVYRCLDCGGVSIDDHRNRVYTWTPYDAVLQTVEVKLS
jgi:hypothetical protein